ncbi:kinase-like domain-containing protein [Rhizophagus irregularis DAOM 181602=DAOM 197198]|nr:kinase-like domain-containing protein [Rhizophagus irregularis DAOM 181602=DAOM 197198]
MQLKLHVKDNSVIEWVPYDQFGRFKEIGKGGFATVYSAKWKDGPLYRVNKWDDPRYFDGKWKRLASANVALKCLDNCKNISEKFLNGVKTYSKARRGTKVLSIYGITQKPDTKEYVMVLEYADHGNIFNWISKHNKGFDWSLKLFKLTYIISATIRQPFQDCAHDQYLALDICKENKRPEINELEAPKCYIDLMKSCWDPDPKNRPSANRVRKLIKLFHDSYMADKSAEIKQQFEEAEKHRKAKLPTKSEIKTIRKFRRQKKGQKRRKEESSSFDERDESNKIDEYDENDQSYTHPQAIYTSRLLKYSVMSEGLDLAI